MDVKAKVLSLAKSDDRIRAVLLNGSRANPNIKPDKYQDYDLIFIVHEFKSFIRDRRWMDIFGKKILEQLPDEMELGNEPNRESHSFTFLMIFEDYSRIDLTIYPYEKVEDHLVKDSLTILWLDKDGLFNSLPPHSDKDYHIKKPSQQEFTEVSNEFWWNITNVAKGLKREEIIFAKNILENVVRPMFGKMIEWAVASDYDFKISLGKSGKLARMYLDEKLYNDILRTYTNANLANNWK